MFFQINDLNSVNKLAINGKEITIEFFLGRDYKFILIMLSLKVPPHSMLVLGAKFIKITDGI